MAWAGEKIKGLQRFEPALFLLLLVVHVSVLFRFEWYPTLDGPAHLYNAHLIQQLLTGNEFLARFLEFSAFPEPNWIGHAIMALLSLVLPANWVEKTVVLLIFCGIAISFRLLIKSFPDRTLFGSVLIFPFLCAHTLRIGFFNFSISIALFLLVLAFWSRMRDRPSVGRIMVLSVLLGALYYSNALSTLICIGTMGLWTLLGPLTGQSSSKERGYRMGALVIASAPWLFLIALFVLRGVDEGTTAYLSIERRWEMFRDGLHFTFLTGDSMITAGRIITWSFVLLAIIGLIARFRRDGSPSFRSTDIWLLMAGLCLIAYLLLPDRAATGGIISVRYLLFFFLFIAIWLAVQARWPSFSGVLLIPFLLADVWLVMADHHFTWELNTDVIEMRSVLPHVRDEAIILPLLYTDNWLISNFSNYLGTERGILVIDNYEAMSPHFPLRWRPRHRAPEMERSFFNSNRPCIAIDSLGARMDLRFDHVIRWEHHSAIADSCTVDLGLQLEKGFREVHRSPAGKAVLYARD